MLGESEAGTAGAGGGGAQQPLPFLPHAVQPASALTGPGPFVAAAAPATPVVPNALPQPWTWTQVPVPRSKLWQGPQSAESVLVETVRHEPLSQ